MSILWSKRNPPIESCKKPRIVTLQIEHTSTYGHINVAYAINADTVVTRGREALCKIHEKLPASILAEQLVKQAFGAYLDRGRRVPPFPECAACARILQAIPRVWTRRRRR